MQDHKLIGVRVEDPDACDGLHRLHKSFINGKGAHGRRYIPAVHRLAYDGAFGAHLTESVVYVHPFPGAFLYYGDFACRRRPAAHAVNLADVWAAQRAQYYLVAQAFVFRQVFFMKEQRLARSAPHENAWYFCIRLHNAASLS